jgi:hypothetical protein
MNCTRFSQIDILTYVTRSGPAVFMDAVREHSGACAECRSRIEAISAEQINFLDVNPFSEQKMPLRIRTNVRVFKLRQVYAIAATLLVFLGTGVFYSARRNLSEMRIKGDTEISVFTLDSLNNPVSGSNMKFLPGKRIQFTYSCGADNNFLLFSIDQTGKITQYFPDTASMSMKLTPGRDMPLPNSILLDDYLGNEAYMAIFSKTPVDVNQVLEHVKVSFKRKPDLLQLETGLPADCSIRTIIIRKTSGE